MLTDDFASHFKLKYGLFYKFRSLEDLKELIAFYSRLKHIDTLFIFHSEIEELRNHFRSCFRCIDAAGGLVKDSKGRILVMKRRGRWDLPKGKLNANEESRHAALRETEEECGLKELTIKDSLIATYHAYMLNEQHVLKRTSWYLMDYTGTDQPVPETEEDITEVRWFYPEELEEVAENTYPTILDVLKYSGLLPL